MIIRSTKFNKQIEKKNILFWNGISNHFYQYSYILLFLTDGKKIKQQQQYNRLIEIQYSKIFLIGIYGLPVYILPLLWTDKNVSNK